MITTRKLCLSFTGLAIGALGFYIITWLKKKWKSLKPSSIILVTNNEEWEKAWEKLSQDLKIFPVLGIDCEWITQVQRNPVSLVQLSSLSGVCVLVRTRLLSKNEGSFPSTFKDLLSDKRILKVGVASIEDSEKLMKDFNLKCFGFVDLRNFVLRCTKLNYRPEGLKRMAKEILDVDLVKSFKVRCGNWETEELSESQILYAALDSLVAVKIFLSLLQKNFGLNEQHMVSLDGKNGNCPKQLALATCQGIVDLKFTAVNHNADKSNHASKKEQGTKELKTSRAYAVRRSPLYHGSKLYSTDCQLLCTCDVKKAQWYLDKNLGEKMSDDPLCVRLLFEPSGRPTNQKDYYLQEKDNICVVCGKQDSYMRKFIIPHEYKKHLPAISKEHKSHDVVLMCVPCHLLSDQLDLPIKAKLADKYNAKIRCDKYLSQSNDIAKVKSSAQALSRDSLSNKIPTARIEELKEVLMDYFKVNEVTNDIIQKGLDLAKEREKNKDFEEHGKKVMESVLAEEMLEEFEVLWRQHFLTSMNPQFMPLCWSVNHGHDKIRCGLDIETTEA